MGSPWRHDLPILNLCEILPQWLTHDSAPFNRMFIHFKKEYPTPKYSSVLIIKEWAILSNAFSKSMANNNPTLLWDLAYSMISYVFLIHSPMYLPETKPFWSSWMMLGRTIFNLSARAPLRIL